ncbi:MAG: response regulator [Thermoplasmatota archaeon]|nr:response regulator [Halobacteriales archaeon]
MLQIAVAATPRTTHKSILVVDDEPDIREAVRDVLESCLEDATVFTADSGRSALAVLGKEKVDLIVTDYKMPGMTGVQLLNEAETLAPGLRHILVTAFDRELLHDLGGRGKNEHIVQKPLDPERLIREVERALGR